MLRVLTVLTVLLSTPVLAMVPDVMPRTKAPAHSPPADGFAYTSRKAQLRIAPASATEAGCLYLSATKLTAGDANYNRTGVTVFFRRTDAAADGHDFSLRIPGQPSPQDRIQQDDRFGNATGICLAPGKYQIDSLEFELPTGSTRPTRFAPIEFELEPGKDHYLGELAFAEKYDRGVLCAFRISGSPACIAMIEVQDALARDEPLLRSARTMPPRGDLQRLRFVVPPDIAISDQRVPATGPGSSGH